MKSAWEAYLLAEAGGVRSAYLGALDEFLELWESCPPSVREIEMPGFPASLVEPEGSVQVRGPLLERVVVPALLREFHAGSARAALGLARLQESQLGSHRCWRRLEVPSVVSLLEEALRRDPSCEAARTELVRRHLDYIGFTLHELPVGVLYGMDGATATECQELEEYLVSVRRSMLPAEIEQYRELLESASFHYGTYRRYLLSRERAGYAAYLMEHGGLESGSEGGADRLPTSKESV